MHTPEEVDLPRSPRSTANSNNPFKPEGYRGPRARSWRDPTGQDATGAASKQDPKGVHARARAARMNQPKEK